MVYHCATTPFLISCVGPPLTFFLTFIDPNVGPTFIIFVVGSSVAGVVAL